MKILKYLALILQMSVIRFWKLKIPCYFSDASKRIFSSSSHHSMQLKLLYDKRRNCWIKLNCMLRLHALRTIDNSLNFSCIIRAIWRQINDYAPWLLLLGLDGLPENLVVYFLALWIFFLTFYSSGNLRGIVCIVPRKKKFTWW